MVPPFSITSMSSRFRFAKERMLSSGVMLSALADAAAGRLRSDILLLMYSAAAAANISSSASSAAPATRAHFCVFDIPFFILSPSASDKTKNLFLL